MTDEDYMRHALLEAAKGAEEGEVPVGAVAVLDGRILAVSHNCMEQMHDATAHAEILLLRKLGSLLGDWRMSDITIYVTKEPCVMCGGAMVNAHLKKVVFGLRDPRSGAETLGLLNNKSLLYQVESAGGILEKECKEQFQLFFKNRRNEKKKVNAII